MKDRALCKKGRGVNKPNNLLHIVTNYNNDGELYYTFDVYDSSNNQKMGDVITLKDANDMIKGWVGKIQINQTLYEPKSN
jgi:hypothetical protein